MSDDKTWPKALDTLLSPPIEEHFPSRDEFTQHRLAKQFVDAALATPTPTATAPQKTSTSKGLILCAAIALGCSCASLIHAISTQRPQNQQTQQTAQYLPAAHTPQPVVINTSATPTTSKLVVTSTHAHAGFKLLETFHTNQSIQTNQHPLTLKTKHGLAIGLQANTQIQHNASAITLHHGQLFAHVAHHNPIIWRLDQHHTLKTSEATFSIRKNNNTWQINILRGHATLQKNKHTQVLMRGTFNHQYTTSPLNPKQKRTILTWKHRLAKLTINQPNQTIIKTKHQNTEIFIDQVFMGKGAIMMATVAGHHTLQAKNPSHQPETHQLILKPEQIHTQHIISKKFKAITSTPKKHHPSALELARQYHQTKHWKKAAMAYKEALSLNTTPRTIHIHLGWIYLRHLAQHQQAKTHFQSYLQSQPHGTLAQEAHLGMIQVHRRANNPMAEAQAIKTLLKKFPNRPDSTSHKKRINNLYKILIKR